MASGCGTVFPPLPVGDGSTEPGGASREQFSTTRGGDICSMLSTEFLSSKQTSEPVAHHLTTFSGVTSMASLAGLAGWLPASVVRAQSGVKSIGATHQIRISSAESIGWVAWVCFVVAPFAARQFFGGLVVRRAPQVRLKRRTGAETINIGKLACHRFIRVTWPYSRLIGEVVRGKGSGRP